MNEPRTPLVVLLHGLFGRPSDFDETVRRLPPALPGARGAPAARPARGRVGGPARRPAGRGARRRGARPRPRRELPRRPPRAFLRAAPPGPRPRPRPLGLFGPLRARLRKRRSAPADPRVDPEPREGGLPLPGLRLGEPRGRGRRGLLRPAPRPRARPPRAGHEAGPPRLLARKRPGRRPFFSGEPRTGSLLPRSPGASSTFSLPPVSSSFPRRGTRR